jgi:fructokinase
MRGPIVLTVVGEALVDLVDTGDHVTFTAYPGGSPLNVAVGLARLGHRTAMLARLAEDRFGQLLRRHALRNGIILQTVPAASEPSTLAVVSLDDAGRADYDFYLNGTADWQWTSSELSMPADTAMLHFGSLASWLPPGDAQIADFAAGARDTTLVSYDPNVRPQLLGHPEHGRTVVERNIGAAHLVKASEEDARWLYPDYSLSEIASWWLHLGPSLVVFTDGGNGATAYRSGQRPLHRPAPPTTVVDTVGAGDAFMAGLLAALAEAHATPAALATLDDTALTRIMETAAHVAALTCQRTGADPPTRADIVRATRRDQPPDA